MSAGTDKDHYMQDTGEKRCVALLQEEAEMRGISIDFSSTDKHRICNDYARERGIEEEFSKSIYNRNLYEAKPYILDALTSKFPNCSFGFTDVEKENRDIAKKGDFLVHVRGEEHNLDISVSLKNHKTSIDSVQLKSGTWISFLVSLFFKQTGTGKYLNHITGEQFLSRDKQDRNTAFVDAGLECIVPCLEFADQVQQEIKAFYASDPQAKYWDDVSAKWKKDCQQYSTQMLDLIAETFGTIDTTIIKDNVLKSAGLTTDEEILLIGRNGKTLFSLIDERYAALLNELKHDETTLQVKKNKKNLVFSFTNNQKTIIEIDIPFTLQKNGAWYLSATKYSGVIYHPKEKIHLSYGERRPKKSNEIATSINMRLNLKKARIVV